MQSIRWDNGELFILDQTKLPDYVEYICCKDYQTVFEAICRLSVRGAPAIGAAAAYGLVLGAMALPKKDLTNFISQVERIAGVLMSSRPTAVNLKWAIDRMLSGLAVNKFNNYDRIINFMLQEAELIYQEDLENNKNIGYYGNKLIPPGARILTHCNAGALATAGYGTALGVIRAAAEADKKIMVYAGETRPLLQGARLTTLEMINAKIPVTLITDNMAGYLMYLKKADLIIIGADRIAANGDTANKIGTYGLAVLAKAHGLPFYVAAPLSTIDIELESGSDIPIEERSGDEVTHIAGTRVAPPGVDVWNPAFDITPAELITSIITEKGIAVPPYSKSLRKLFET
ncbi:MAG: S-methyl-5-thioribose-1-phosphate isomerase [Peptococcaceae bacterium]|nr:S-methyl-5-thioribose-1-phosphate isomerase [Peptococcaceae bacterium]